MKYAYVHNTVDWVGVTGATALSLRIDSMQSARLAAPFERWQHQVQHSRRSRAYFVQILRPRLLALWEHQRRVRGASGLTDGTVPSVGEVEPGPLALLWHEPPRQLRRGLSLRTLQALAQALEERS